ncbi:flagellar hook-length control protein FliK [bacterium]|nr:flagellar hook-length control protein FliK [bacterium]
MTSTATILPANTISAESAGFSNGTLPAATGENSSADVFAEIFARLVGSNLPSLNNLVSPSLASNTLPAGDSTIPTTVPIIAGDVKTTLPTETIPTFESIQAFSTALANFLTANPAVVAGPAQTKPAEEGTTIDSTELAASSTDLLTNFLLPVVSLTAPSTSEDVPDTTVPSSNAAANTDVAATSLLTEISQFANVIVPANTDLPKGRVQPFQPGFQFGTRRINDAEQLAGSLPLTTGPIDLGSKPSLESILGSGRSNRLVVDKSVLKTVEKLLGRTTKEDHLAERGVSILTPEELKNPASTVEDRNATALARVDRGEFVNRVLQALERAHLEQPKRIEIELQPPALGKIKLQVIERHGELTARIEVESTTTRSLLVDNLSTLDRHLGEQGVQIQRFQVDQTNTGDSGLGERSQDQSQQNPGQDAREQQRGREFYLPSQEDSEALSSVSLAELFGLADGVDQVI